MSIESRLQAEEQKSANSKSIIQLTALSTLAGNESIPAWSPTLSGIVQIPVSLLSSGGAEDGNEEVIIRGDAIEDVAPSTGEIANPISGDTASIYLTSAKMEKWVYTTVWAKAFTITSAQAPKTAGNGLTETATEFKLGDQTVDEDVELILIPIGVFPNQRKYTIKFNDDSTIFEIGEISSRWVAPGLNISAANLGIGGDNVGMSGDVVDVYALNASNQIGNSRIRFSDANLLIKGSAQLTIQPPNNDLTPGSQLNFVLTKIGDSGDSEWVDPNTLVGGSQAFEQTVTAAASSVVITSPFPIKDIDLYIDLDRLLPSQFTLDTNTNTVDFGANTIPSGVVLNGRIYF